MTGPELARTLCVLSCVFVAWVQPAIAAPGDASRPPNVLLVLVDDAALTDFGFMGGEARTPRLDSIARRGMVFTNFHTSPMCAPTRAMLLTGLDSHLVGLGNLPEIVPETHVGRPGYAGHLEPGVRTVASRLRSAGYRTHVAGKWHLGHGEGALPIDHGFDRSFVVDATGADHWDERPYLPFYEEAHWYADGEPARLPEDYYSSRFLVDRLIAYLDEAEDPTRPFFAYLPFLAVHLPLQAPREITESYLDTYREGWEALRRSRWRRAVEDGWFPADAPLADPPAGLRPWSAFSEEERRAFAERMAVYAAMLDAMDRELGRLLDHLAEKRALENTIVIVASDNGPESASPADALPFRLWARANGYSALGSNLGERNTFVTLGAEAAFATASPNRLFKARASEGGIRVPLVIAGPGVERGVRTNAFSFVTDVAPTILDLAGVPFEADEMTGRSLHRMVTGDAVRVYGESDAVGLELAGSAALFKGSWKLVRDAPDWGDGRWRLHDLARDPGETRDLRVTHPERFAELRSDYRAYARRVGVLPTPAGYVPERAAALRMLGRLAGRNASSLAGIGLLTIAGVGFARNRIRRKRVTAVASDDPERDAASRLWRVALALNGLVLTAVAFQSLLSPAGFLAGFDVVLPSATALAETRSIHGGGFAALAVLMWLGLLHPRYRRTALRTAAFFMGGLAAGRLLGIAVDGATDTETIQSSVVEGVLAALAILALWRSDERLSKGRPNMRILKILGFVIGGFALFLTTLAISARFSDGPIAIFPGGPFESGEFAPDSIDDFTFAEELQVLELESAGRSRTTNVLVHDGKAYLGAVLAFPPGKTWHVEALEDPAAVVRIEGRRYRRRLVRVEDPVLHRELAEAFLAKYGPGLSGGEPGGDPSWAWFFALEPRAETGGGG